MTQNKWKLYVERVEAMMLPFIEKVNIWKDKPEAYTIEFIESTLNTVNEILITVAKSVVGESFPELDPKSTKIKVSISDHSQSYRDTIIINTTSTINGDGSKFERAWKWHYFIPDKFLTVTTRHHKEHQLIQDYK